MSRGTATLTELARWGFARLSDAAERLRELPADLSAESLVPLFSLAADPDQALRLLLGLLETAPEATRAVLADAEAGESGAAAGLVRVLGASEGLAAFLHRHPEQLSALREPIARPGGVGPMVVDGTGETAWCTLRISYRRELLRLAAWDLAQPDPAAVVDQVASALADLAGAALDASLLIARAGAGGDSTPLAVIGMGKAGARELNYLSDVDVIFVTEGDDAAVARATKLARETMRGIQELAVEPGLWEVDANLRPEGKDGALVRTLASHLAYYERWAKSWEFQALLKARPLAGDRELGERYVEGVAPMVWAISTREGFVENVQRMRERVTAHIPTDEVDVQLKLGPGGLRDVEFTVQLLQLVHGHADPAVRVRSTLEALRMLAEQGYIGRVEAAEFARDYRFLRTLEHRLQLSRLRRTHLMPRDDDAVRVLARASGLATSAGRLVEAWQAVKLEVRSLHERLFYRPLLSAVAALPEDGYALTSEQAEARLAAIGFQDPAGALRHIGALTSGVSRRAQIQRTLLPVVLQWLSEGADPDYGLLAFRRLSDELGEAYWFLRMLRDSSGAAKRLTEALSGSRYVGGLLERIPEAAAWLEDDAELCPRPLAALLEESQATIARHLDEPDVAAGVLRTARRREVLRVALGGILGLLSIEDIAQGLTDITSALLQGVLDLVHRPGDGIEFGVIAMGRYGGAELGFGSDADVMWVYRPAGADDQDAQRTAEGIVREMNRLTEDLRLPFDLDIGLRPEGRNGAVVRSLESYRAYYARWSLTWEAQALLRARGAAGDPGVLSAFEELADAIRYPAELSATDVREVRRIKARVESERLPQGADSSRHLKLGRGSLSDVEWFVQLLQLQRAATTPALRTTSTLHALAAATAAGLVSDADAMRLRAAWLLASRVRSAVTLWTAKTADLLPTDRRALEGVARLLEYPPGSASRLEEDYLRVTRVARQVFERGFYGEAP